MSWKEKMLGTKEKLMREDLVFIDDFKIEVLGDAIRQISDMEKQSDAYGDMLLELAEKDDRVIAVDADVAIRMGTEPLKDKYPDRHINVGIAEQNMIGVSAGLAAAGKIPFAGTIATFATGRTYDQIRQSFKGAYKDLQDEQQTSVRGGQGLAYDQM